jgi:hypothetical protein
MESITSLLIKLNTQISEATSANRPISQLENDLIKETLRKMYDMIGNTNTVTNIQATQEQQIIIEEKSPAIGFATMVQETMKHQLKEEPKIIAPPIHQETIPTPVVATTTPRVMETIASPAMETASAPEEVTVLKAAPVAVTEIPMEIDVVIPETGNSSGTSTRSCTTSRHRRKSNCSTHTTDQSSITIRRTINCCQQILRTGNHRTKDQPRPTGKNLIGCTATHPSRRPEAIDWYQRTICIHQ